MIIVSDASPLVTLARIGRLELLPALYGRVIVPEAVWREVTASAPEKAGAADLRAARWLEHRAVGDRARVARLLATLDQGESEAIVLADEVGADLLLMDERLGREQARREGVRVIGLLGVLAEAKRHGQLAQLAPVLAELRAAGFHLSGELTAHILRQAGETG